MKKNRLKIIKFVVALGVCFLFLLAPLRYADALSLRGFDIDQTRGYQKVFLDGLFSSKKKKQQKTLAEELVDFKIIDRESFYKYSPEIHKIPFNDPALSFRIRIPDSWEEIPQRLEKTLKLTSDLMSNLVHYIGPPISELRPFLRIQAMKLTREIDAENWLRYFLLVNGYTISEKGIETPDFQNASARFVYVKEDVTYIGYFKAIIHGNIVSLARLDVPQKFWGKYRVLQKESVDSFQLVFPQTGNIESHKKQKFAGGSLYLSYPITWERKKQRHNDRGDKIAFALHNIADEKTVFGLIQFKAFERTDKTSFEEVVKELRDNIKGRFHLYVKSINSSEPSYGPIRFDYIREEKYEVGFKKGINVQDQELTLLVMADTEWYIFIYMISPLKQNDLYNWAVNRRAFDIIKESFE